MSIKSDKWIRENSLLRDMIVPFVMDNENKIVVHGEEKKVPSFGLSSYGYDVRLGPNFKFFRGQEAYLVRSSPNSGGGLSVNTPVLASTLGRSIDIADFTNTCELASFEDLAWIELPAKSFCLGHTIEKVTVPRDVSVVCMGKSTVARAGIIVTVTPLESEWCFTGDTEVALANGTSMSFKEMEERAKTGERFFGYTFRNDGTIGIEELLNPRKTRAMADLVEVTLDTGDVIRCTPNHKFLTKKFGYVEAQNLEENISLMPLYRYVDKKGYESVAGPVQYNTRPIYTHKLSDQWNLENHIYPLVNGHVRHHIDFNPRNNYPTNIIRMSDEDHHKVHETKEGYTEERKRIAAISRESFYEKCRTIANFREIMSEVFSKAARTFWDSPEHAETRAGWLKAHSEPRPYRLKYFDRQVVLDAFKEYGSIRQAGKALKTKADTLARRFPDIVAQARSLGYIPMNHTVKSVKKLVEKEDVYCLTVPNTSNFALDAGVFVHNCGNITLEITNTTDLPVRIYPGMGITQLQFFQSDEQCLVSYADRNGKYQNQPAEPVPPM